MSPGFHSKEKQRSGKATFSVSPREANPECSPTMAFACSPSTWQALPTLPMNSYSHFKAQLKLAPQPSTQKRRELFLME